MSCEGRHDLQIQRFNSLLKCRTCKENYIGQTGKPGVRVRVHKQQIRHPPLRQIPLSEHLEICANGKLKNFAINKCCRDDEELYKKALEKHSIKTFKAKLFNA